MCVCASCRYWELLAVQAELYACFLLCNFVQDFITSFVIFFNIHVTKYKITRTINP